MSRFGQTSVIFKQHFAYIWASLHFSKLAWASLHFPKTSLGKFAPAQSLEKTLLGSFHMQEIDVTAIIITTWLRVKEVIFCQYHKQHKMM